ncbi:DegT/DnrJ/EryC1/StrS family aminotransferase [Candidatus Altiarchaeota archaeon]
MIPIAKPVIGEEEKKAVMEVMDSGMIASGPKTKEFEAAFAEYIGTKHAVATTSGTTALHTALLGMGIKPGDEIITTAFTFIASANSILMANAKPVFIDIDDDYNICEEAIKEAITPKTKAILPVHIYGNPCDMDAMMEIAQDSNLVVCEDACQAHGAEWKGKRVGSFGTGTFSLYPTKNMMSGEGGMITTDDDEVAENCRLVRNHGSAVRYYHDILGYNFRMTDMCAAIGLVQLGKVEGFNEKRIANAKALTEGLSQVKGIIPPKTKPDTRHVYHQYTIRVTDEFPLSRDDVLEKLKEKEIGSAIFYPLPINKQKSFTDIGYGSESLPKSEEYSDQVMSLPVHPQLQEGDTDAIVKAFEEMSQ